MESGLALPAYSALTLPRLIEPLNPCSGVDDSVTVTNVAHVPEIPVNLDAAAAALSDMKHTISADNHVASAAKSVLQNIFGDPVLATAFTSNEFLGKRAHS